MKWEARYTDGTTLPQYHEDGRENRYADIDRARLASFAVLSDDGQRLIFEMHLDPRARLIFRRRVEQGPGHRMVVHMIGWQRTVGGENVQSIAYITECGEIHMAGAWREDHPWFYPAQPVPCEQEEA